MRFNTLFSPSLPLGSLFSIIFLLSPAQDGSQASRNDDRPAK